MSLHGTSCSHAAIAHSVLNGRPGWQQRATGKSMNGKMSRRDVRFLLFSFVRTQNTRTTLA
jgi:hypothetical protein